MEIGYVASELWRLRRWVALGTIVAVVAAIAVLYELPSFEKKSFELGAASTDVLVERSGIPLGVIGTDEALAGEAILYARLLGTPPVKERIAQKAGVSVGPIANSTQTGQTGREVASEQRAGELVEEGNSYRILATPAPDLPLISIAIQGPTAQEAARVADAAVFGLRTYVSDIAAAEGVSRNVRFRQLGLATGGTVTQNANVKVAGMAFVGAFVAWALLVLLAARLRAGWRESQATERLSQDAVPEAGAARRLTPDDLAA